MPTAPDEIYDAEYYASRCSERPYARNEPQWQQVFGGIADEIARSLRPRRVFDAGCAHGFLVEALWDRGVQAWGRDISSFAVSQARADMRSFVSQGSVADPIDGQYELVTCIEVLEQMEEGESIRAVAAIAAAAPKVLFSSSPTDLAQPTHVNVKPVIWWLRQFAAAGMAPVSDYDASFVAPQAYLLERTESVPSERDLLLFAALVGQRVLAHERGQRLAAAEREAADLERAMRVAQDQVLRAKASTEAMRQEAAAHAALAGAAVAERSRIQAERDAVEASIRRVEANLEAARRETVTQAAIVDATEADRTRVEERASRAEAAAQEQVAILATFSWQMTEPVRTYGRKFPRARSFVQQFLRVAYWTATFQLRSRLAEHRAAPRGLVRGTSDVDQRAPAAEPVPPTAQETSDVQPISADAEQSYDRWVREHDTISAEDQIQIRDHVARLGNRPLISVIVPTYETPERFLREAINSVRAQLYPYWELCVVDDTSLSPHATDIVREAAAADPRIKRMRR